VVVETVSDKVDLKKFYNLYVKTRRHLQLPPHPFRMFENMWNIFYPPGYLSLLLAKFREKVIAGIILFKFKSRVSGEYEAWDREYKHFCPVHLLIWEAIRQASQQNYQLFDFGRTSQYNLGLLEFKKRWGTDQTRLTYFYFPAHFSMKKGQPETSLKYKLVQTVSGILPPSLLPAFGNFCYQHLG
jgi:lipid II:glycine glycyltransferase (peptidoglycan interpeptide bridge formation enzyme)